ncbi:MAG: BamA/TamA family outer membrane protein [candidate division KSB1 bacterium]|nr:BamA/TamA family outer membrane protein [candidate division KSB1 bacterium]
MSRVNLFIVSILVLWTVAQAQYFGKNKVQTTVFKWQYLQSEHFDIYFTEGGKSIAEFTARVGEESYRSISGLLRFELLDRVKIIVYNSHNDFGQTNVDLSPPEETVGGFTEFFKNRVVIPYEGEWEKFRHVIHHELTHAVMLQMVYGAGTQSIISGIMQFQLPLWLIEGLAEYESRGWDIESDMFMRDASVHGYLPEIPYLNGFLAYKGGQSVLRYIAETYGEEKISELINKMKMNRGANRGMKQAIGIEEKELTKRWQLYLKRLYWPDIADRKEPEEIAKRITDHRKWNNFVNTSPAISKKGDKIAFLSDKDDYFDIYIAGTIDGRILSKVVRGQRAGNLEELHWLRGRGIDWSPDDRFLVFSAKAGAEDQLHIVDVKKRKIVRSIAVGLDGIYNSAWSPKGDEIAFMGVKNGQSDIYAYNLDTNSLRKITDDPFSDVEPCWSPDGSKLVFASDRNDYLTEVPQNFRPEKLNMKDYDIFEIGADGRGLRKIVDSPFLDRSPVYSPDGTTIAFSSDRSGVSNIYLKQIDGEEWPITNVVTGAYLPSWGGSRNQLAFTSFYYAGYDVYVLRNPLEIQPGDVTVRPTQFVQSLQEKPKITAEPVSPAPQPNRDLEKYRTFVFDEKFADGEIEINEHKVFLDSTDYFLPTGEFKVSNYEVKFTPDLVYGSVGYDQFFGTQGYTTIMLSDVLGDHRINLALNLYGDFKNADYAVVYYYLKRRLDVGGGVYHNAYFFYSPNAGWVRDRNYGLSIMGSNPFDRYRRISGSMTLMGISRDYLDLPDEYVDWLARRGYISPTNRYFLLGDVTYTVDNTIWGYTGPVNGTRWGVSLSSSPQLGDNGIDFTTLRGDWRRYFKLYRDYVISLRAASGASFGKHPQKFFLGGEPNWINYRYNGGIRVDHIEEIYFASFEMPLRGAGYYAIEGNRFLLTNLEFRFPFVRYLQLGFPFPLTLGNLAGALFLDSGFAWDRGDNVALYRSEPQPTSDKSKQQNLTLFKRAPNGLLQAEDLYASIGWGLRIDLGIFLLRVDFAWPTNFYSTSKDMQVLWSLGADF